MSVEVFKTNVVLEEDALLIVRAWKAAFPRCRMNFDLDDCDRVLRVEGDTGVVPYVVDLLKFYGFECEVLPD